MNLSKYLILISVMVFSQDVEIIEPLAPFALTAVVEDDYDCNSSGVPVGYCILTTDSYHPTQMEGAWVFTWNNFFIAVDEVYQGGSVGNLNMQFIPPNKETLADFKAMVYTLWVSNSKAVFIFDKTKCIEETSVSVIRCPLAAITAVK